MFFALSLCDHLFCATQAEVKFLRKNFPKAIIIIGGPSVNTAKNIRSLADFFPDADVLARGDGEPVIALLVRAYSSSPVDRRLIATMEGVHARDGNFVYCREKPNLLTHSSFNAQPGITAYTALVEQIISEGMLRLNTSRDCRYRCIFCSHKYHPKPIYWTAERIILELKRIKGMVEEGKLPPQARQIFFVDDDFIQDQDRAVEFIKLLTRDQELNEFFDLEFLATVGSFYSAGKLRDDILDGLTQFHSHRIQLGTDGFHPLALKWLKKGYSWPQAFGLMVALARRQISQEHHVILTYPEITRQALIETLANMYGVLLICNGSVVNFSINRRPIALESNGLMPLTNNPHQVSNLRGEVKLLPKGISLRDRQLDRDFGAIIKMRLTKDRIEEIVRRYDSVAGISGSAVMSSARFADEQVTMGDALSAHIPFLRAAAILAIMEELHARR